MDAQFQPVDDDRSDALIVSEKAFGGDAVPVRDVSIDQYAQAELERRHARTELMIKRAIEAGAEA